MSPEHNTCTSPEKRMPKRGKAKQRAARRAARQQSTASFGAIGPSYVDDRIPMRYLFVPAGILVALVAGYYLVNAATSSSWALYAFLVAVVGGAAKIAAQKKPPSSTLGKLFLPCAVVVLAVAVYFSVDTATPSQLTLNVLVLAGATKLMFAAHKRSSASPSDNVPAPPKDRKEDPLLGWERPAREECPVCLLPLPIDDTAEKGDGCYYNCCGSFVCNGCMYDQIRVAFDDAREKGDIKGGAKPPKMCPFCRDPGDKYDTLQRELKLAKAGRHRAIWRVGGYYLNGRHGLQQSDEEAMKWFRRAAEAGSAGAANAIALCYMNGDILPRDMKRALEYSQKAADLGRVTSFGMAGQLLLKEGDLDGAFLSFRKGAICGLSDAHTFNVLREGFKAGYITKDEYAMTLRENQKSVNEMKSESREAWKEMKGRMPSPRELG